MRPWTPRRLLAGGETVEARRDLLPGDARPGPLARPPRLLRRRRAASPATSSSPARSAAPTSRSATGTTLLDSIRSLVERYPPETIVYPGTARRRRSAPSSPATRFSRCALRAACTARGVGERARVSRRIERPRGTHDILPSEQPLWRRVTGEMERLCALYGYRPIQTPVFEDTELFARTSGAGLGRRPEGDVHVRRPLRPLADAAAGGDGADLPRLRRARPAPRAAAAEALHDRADVPLRRARPRALPRALAALGRGDRLGRSGDRRRDHPALRHAPAPARRRRTTGSS